MSDSIYLTKMWNVEKGKLYWSMLVNIGKMNGNISLMGSNCIKLPRSFTPVGRGAKFN